MDMDHIATWSLNLQPNFPSNRVRLPLCYVEIKKSLPVKDDNGTIDRWTDDEKGEKGESGSRHV